MKANIKNRIIENSSKLLVINLILISLIYSLQQNKQNKKYQRTISSSSSSGNNTLFEVPIYRNTEISYYYPYFYKSHLITFTDFTINANTTLTNLTTNNNTNIPICVNDRCQMCDGSGRCIKCVSGWFLTEEGTCQEACEAGFIADILRRKCFSLNSRLPDIVFTKAYSFGSCKGNCLKNSVDCSCAADCSRKGDCCTDYLSSDCDEISILANNDINNGFNDRNKNETTENDRLCTDAVSGCEICEERTDVGFDGEIDFIFYQARKKKNLRKRLRENFGIKKNNTNLTNKGKKSLSFRKKNKLKNDQLAGNFNQTNSTIGNFSVDNYLNNTNATVNANKTETFSENKKEKNYVCRQCKQGYLMFNGTCVSDCPKGFASDLYNIECVGENDRSIKCHKQINNCSRCYELLQFSSNSTDVTSMFSCSKCKRGLFLLNNTCIEECPEKYRADKMTWNCIPKPIFAWYWTYPSRSSCRGFCRKKSNDTDSNNNTTYNLNSNNTNVNATDADKIKENVNVEGKNHSNYFNYTNATAILHKIKEDLNLKEEIKDDLKPDCTCDSGCQQRGNCCYDFDIYCLNQNQ